MDKQTFDKINKAVDELADRVLNGGKGSGNFGHAGRPGERGGSAPQGSGKTAKRKPTSDDDIYAWGKKNLSSPEDMRHGEEASFDQILARMYDGKDFYKEFGDLDSVDREKVFEEMAKRTGLEYDDIYYTWLQGHEVDLAPTNPNYEAATQAEKNVRQYLQKLTDSPRERELEAKGMSNLSDKEKDEYNLRSMVGSVWTYGGGKESSYLADNGSYASLTPKERKKIIDDEWAYLDKHVETDYAGEDSEGVSYQSQRFKR